MDALKVIMTASNIARMSKQEVEFLASALVQLKDATIAERLAFLLNVEMQEKLMGSEKEIA